MHHIPHGPHRLSLGFDRPDRPASLCKWPPKVLQSGYGPPATKWRVSKNARINGLPYHVAYHPYRLSSNMEACRIFSCPEIHSRSYNLDILGPCDSYGTSLVVSQVSCTTGAVFCWNTCQFQAPGRCWKGNNTHIPLKKKTHANPASPRGSRPYAPALHISQRNGHSRSSSPPIRPQIPHLKSAVQQDIELYGNRKRNATYFQVVVVTGML